LISENVSVLTNKENTLEILIDLYLKKNLFTTVIEALNKNSLNIGIQTQMTNNLSAKLYMIGKANFLTIYLFENSLLNLGLLKVHL
jgi:hypothetical protein